MTRVSGREKCEGAALIIVLGMLAILLILASAFSVNMRVERMAAGNARFGVSTRHMLLGAVARAVDAIERETTNSAAPDWIVLSSSNGLEGAQLAWGEAMKYIPAALKDAVEDAPAAWESFPNMNGRYAYLVVNVSSFLDANVVGGQPRYAGTSPVEVTLGCLPEVKDTNLLYQCRESDVRYETLKEFGELQEGYGLTNDLPDHFVVYSRYPFGYLKGTNIVTDVVSVKGEASDLLGSQLQIQQAFEKSGVPAQGAPPAPYPMPPLYVTAMVNMFDGIDDDRLPANLGGAYNAGGWNGPYVDAFPMFNEVSMRVQLQVTTNAALEKYQCAGAYYLSFECAYPFVHPDPTNGYKLAEISAVISNAAWAGDWNFTPSTPSPNPIQPPDQDLDILFGNHFWTYTANPAGFPNRPLPDEPDIPDDLTLFARVTVRVKDSDNKVVDGVQSNDPVVVRVTIPNIKDRIVNWPNYPQMLVIKTNVTAECIDPRLNWQGGIANGQWAITNKPTIGTTNSAAMIAYRKEGCDGDGWMCVKQKPLESVGDIGNVFFGKPWETIRLLRRTNAVPEVHLVLDNFTLLDDTAKPRKGLFNINVNEHNASATAAVFTNMPVREYYQGSEQMCISNKNTLVSIHNALLDGGPYTNLSDIGNADWGAIADAMGFPADRPLNEIDREAFIRNSAGMVGTRQNLFMILAAAGPFRISPGIAAFRGDWLARSRAVAMVWRDPYPDENGRHPCFVRLFKVLGDE